MKMRKSLVAGLAVASTIGFFTPLTSQAFGLGQIELKSALNQPFRAEIDVTALPDSQRELLEVNMASREEFSKAGLDRPVLYTNFNFEVVEQGGQIKVLVSSKDPVKEPFLDFLLTATTGQGKLIREYTVLLDPPEFVMAAVNPQPVKPTTKPQTVTTPVQPAQKSSRATSYDYANNASGYQGSEYGPVKRTDTLWQIALNTRPNQDISVHQMMLALVEANPSAFSNQNINGLKAGTRLNIPSLSSINSISKADAFSLVKAQNTAWANRNKTTPTVTAQTTVVTEPDSDTSVTEPETSSTTMEQTETTDAVMENNGGQLELVAPEELETSNADAATLAMGSSNVDTLNEQLTLAEEAIEAKTQENVDFQARVEDLEQQVETMRRMLSIKDDQLAQLQGLLEDDADATAMLEEQISTDDASTAEATSEQAAPAATDIAEQVNAEQTEAVAATTAAVTESQPEADSEQAMTDSGEMSADTATAPEPVAATEPEQNVITQTAESLGVDPQQVQSLFDKVKQFVIAHKVETAGGLLMLLLLLLLISRRKNRAVPWDEAVEEAVPQAEAEVTNAPLQAQDELDDTADELAQAVAPSNKTTQELIEQADMFVGYADYVQAKNALEQAVAQAPDNMQAVHKLLFVLYKQNRSDEFFNLFEQNQHVFAEDSSELAEVKQWGSELFPDSPLFKVAAASSVMATAATALNDADTTTAQQEAVSPSNEAEADEVEAPEAEEHIEFNLDDFATDSTVDETADEDKTDDNLLKFDLNEQADSTPEETLSIDTLDLSDEFDESETEVEAEQTSAEDSEEDKALDESLLAFDIADTSADEDRDSADALDSEEFDIATSDATLDDLEFEIPADTGEVDLDLGDMEDIDEIDEAETKLDLAAAYIDMEDPDGARSILNEVLTDGNDEQKGRAQALLNSLD